MKKRRVFVAVVSNYTTRDSPNLKKLREHLTRRGVDFAIVRSPDELLEVQRAATHVILTGSSISALSFMNRDIVRMNVMALLLDVPKLCICYSHQLLATLVGGTIRAMPAAVTGVLPARLDTRHWLFRGVDADARVRMSHRTCVYGVPPDFRVIATSRKCRIQAIADDARKMYGVQFHPEALPGTTAILDNFCAFSGRT